MTVAVDVEAELAASILAMWHVVRLQLATERPQVGRIADQATDAFRRNIDTWHTLVANEAAELAGDRAVPYARQLGLVLEDAAKRGLSSAMGHAVGQGWDPEVAWQRVLPGYGLDPVRMHGIMAGAIQAPGSGTGSSPDGVPRAAAQALVRYAKDLARVEIRSWSRAASILTKAYDPHEPRDADGKWTRNPGARVKEREVTPLDLQVAQERKTAKPTDDPFADVGDDPFAGVPTDPYATVDPFAATPTADPFAAAQDPFGVARDPFGDLKTGKTVRRVDHYLFRRPLGAKGPAPEEGDPPARGGFVPGHYLALAKLHGYYHGSGRELSEGSTIDFSDIADYIRGGTFGAGDRVELERHSSPFDAADVPKELSGIRPAQWDEALDFAYPLWRRVADDPEDFLDSLTAIDLGEIAERAGYDSTDPDLVRDQIKADAAGRRLDPLVHDGNLIDAMADYIVWSKPKPLYDYAHRHANLDLEERVSELYITLEGMGIDKLRTAPIPAVLNFTAGLHPRDEFDTADMQGQYRVHRVTYQSAIGTLRKSAPFGKIGVQEITVRPDHRV